MVMLFKWFYTFYDWASNIVDFFGTRLSALVGDVDVGAEWVNDFLIWVMELIGDFSLFELIFGGGFLVVLIVTLVKWIVELVV